MNKFVFLDCLPGARCCAGDSDPGLVDEVEEVAIVADKYGFGPRSRHARNYCSANQIKWTPEVGATLGNLQSQFDNFNDNCNKRLDRFSYVITNTK